MYEIGIASGVYAPFSLLRYVLVIRARRGDGPRGRPLRPAPGSFTQTARRPMWGCVYSVGSDCAGVCTYQATESVSSLDSVIGRRCYQHEGRWLGLGGLSSRLRCGLWVL